MATCVPSAKARPLPAMAAATVVAAAGALILGEYDLSGFTPYVASVLLGLIVAEVVLIVGRGAGVRPAAIAGGLTLAALVWAVWIATNHWRAPVPVGAWIGTGLGPVVAFAWVSASGRRARSTSSGR